MRSRIVPGAAVWVALMATAAVSAGGEPDVARLVRLAVSDGPAGDAARQRLRALGPDGLHALVSAHAQRIEGALEPESESAPEPDDQSWRALCDALDAVGRAKDNHAARLYWYTDLEQAKSAARAANRPILSLRLLGGLDDEFSCANSRFFRTVLYANAEVSKTLREQFILHWQSVRPAPRVTIDFGDGRVLERTITGNSIHYVLDCEGRVVDALPGLYGPADFLSQATAAAALATTLRSAPDAHRAAVLQDHHALRLAELRRRWTRDLRVVPAALATAGVEQELTGSLPRAEEAAPVAAAKTVAEAPILAATRVDDAPLRRRSDEVGWERLAEAWLPRVQFDAGTIRLMLRKSRPADPCPEDGRLDADAARLVESFRRQVALDTVRNEYLLHREIHGWFAAGEVRDLDALNERVYRELFLTPDTDPWLGLLPRDVYTALPADGVTRASAPRRTIAGK